MRCSHVTVSLISLRVTLCLVTLVFTSACTRPSEAEPVEAHALQEFSSIPGELNKQQSEAFFDTLTSSRLLERPKLSKQTIELIGSIMARTNGDPERQTEYLEGFSGLLTRVGIDIDPLGFANLEDRLARKQGKPQPFGTLVYGSHDYPDADATRIYWAARDMIGVDRRIPIKPVTGSVRLAMHTPAYPTLPAVRKELLKLGKIDQDAREEPPKGLNHEDEKELIRRMAVADAYTLPRIRAIFDRYGIPTPSEVGRAATHTAFLLIQHAIRDPALMRGAVAQARQLESEGELPAIDYALFSDRVDCVIDHRPQSFGTQGSRDPRSFWFCPITDPQHVNDRRARLHLSPLTKEEIYGKGPLKESPR